MTTERSLPFLPFFSSTKLLRHATECAGSGPGRRTRLIVRAFVGPECGLSMDPHLPWNQHLCRFAFVPLWAHSCVGSFWGHWERPPLWEATECREGGRRGGSAGILHLHCLGLSSLDSSARKGESRLRLLPSPVGRGTRLAAAHLAPSNHWTLNFPFCAPLSSCVA